MGADGVRCTIRLGKATVRQAEAVKFRIEQLALAATGATGVVDDDTVRWLAGLGDTMYGKLASVGLVEPRTSSALGDFLDGYLRSRNDLKPNSQLVYGHTRRTLIEFFGQDKPLRTVTEDDAKRWREYLIGQGLSEATVCKRCGNAKVFFGVAVRRKLISGNPFSGLDSRSKANKSRQRFIGREDSQKILDACPNGEWRAIFALARYGGLRCPSEVLGLRWQDIDWDRARIHVTSPKTAHFEGRGSREIPLFPELVGPVQELFEQAAEGAEYVIVRYRRTNSNLRTQLERIIKKAGLNAWPRVFQNLRSSRETELAETYPLHVVTYWIGNTARIAERHYLQVPDAMYEQAAQNRAHVMHETQKEAQQPIAMLCTQPHEDSQESTENADVRPIAMDGERLQSTPVETKGIEPSFRRCDRRVLPLHHVPRNNFDHILPPAGR
jgi:integrase